MCSPALRCHWRRSFPQEYVTATDSITEFRLQKTGERSYRFVTNDAREMARR